MEFTTGGPGVNVGYLTALREKEMRHDIRAWIQESMSTKQMMYHSVAYANQIRRAAEMLIDCIRGRGTIMVCGNGGSAGDSGHFVGELLNRFTTLREYPLAAIDLAAPNSTITAIANDYSFDEVFAKQIQALGEPEHVLVAISTSGTSSNIIRAVEEARKLKMGVIVLTGNANPFPDLAGEQRFQIVGVPSTTTPLIQEAHIMIIHIWCFLLDKEVEGEDPV